MGKKPIVSITYENERISIKNSLPYIKCVLCLSCVVHEPIYGRLMGCTVILSLHKGIYYRADTESKPVPITPKIDHKSTRKPYRREETHNLSKVSRFLFKSFYIRRLEKQLFSPIQILIF